MPVKLLRTEDTIHPRELTTADTTTTLRSGRQISPEETFWRRKQDEAYRSGITQSIAKEGMVNPVRLQANPRGPIIANGYHRVAAAHDIDPWSFVPVTYENKRNAREDELPVHWNREDEEYLYGQY
jgi:hypothetical protein